MGAMISYDPSRVPGESGLLDIRDLHGTALARGFEAKRESIQRFNESSPLTMNTIVVSMVPPLGPVMKLSDYLSF